MVTRDVRYMLIAALAAGMAFMAVLNGYGAEPADRGVAAVMEKNLAACTEENLPRLLQCMAQEMPNRPQFIAAVKAEWAASDAYWRLEKVKVLRESNAPHAKTKFPYATALITQSCHKLENPKDKSVFRSSCKNGRCNNADQLARLMTITQEAETVEFQALFKFEQGKWKCVANLTEPRPVRAEEPAAALAGRSVF
jgi:hypothetical protein